MFWAGQSAHAYDMGRSRASQRGYYMHNKLCIPFRRHDMSTGDEGHGFQQLPLTVSNWSFPTLLACHVLKPTVAGIPQSRRGVGARLAKQE